MKWIVARSDRISAHSHQRLGTSFEARLEWRRMGVSFFYRMVGNRIGLIVFTSSRVSSMRSVTVEGLHFYIWKGGGYSLGPHYTVP